MENTSSLLQLYCNTWFKKCGHYKLPYLLKPSLTHQGEWVISMWWIRLLDIFTNWFLHGRFFLETLLWMEPPICGSLMSTFVVKIAKSLLPLDIINILPSLMWRRPFTSLPLSCCHSLPALENHVVMQATKTTWFSMPWFLLIINMLVIKWTLEYSDFLYLSWLSLVLYWSWDISLALPMQCALSWQECDVFQSSSFFNGF